MATTPRDLGDHRLWDASLHRSIERRRAASARPALPVVPRRAATVAIAVSAVAVPAAPAGATDGLAAVQRALGVTPDGVMGPETRSALTRFQREHGLPSVGVAGPRTRAALGLAGRPGSRRHVRRTVSSLAAVQRKLGVHADGAMGPVTRGAIRDFQSRHSLEATGRLDAATRAAILQSDDAAAPSAATPRSVPAASSEDVPAAPPAAGVSAAVDAARAQVGKPYQSSGKGPGGFDCSGLTAFAFRAAGISLGSSSYAQYGQGTSVERSEIQAGDLVFFNTNGGGASHVGVATSPTTMISATTHGVMESSFSSGYWAAHYVGARQVG